MAVKPRPVAETRRSPAHEPGSTGVRLSAYFFFGLRTGTFSVTVVFGRRVDSPAGTKRPVPASRVTFFGISITPFPLFGVSARR